jgi:hypothetical protein
LTIVYYGDTWVNRSGSIASANTAQQVADINPQREGFWIQNVSDTEMWINELGAAVTGQPSIKIPAGAMYEFPKPSPNAISIICSASGKQFSAREW